VKCSSGIAILCVRMFGIVALLGLAEIANAQALLPGIPTASIPTGAGIRVWADWADPEDVEGNTWGIWGGLGFARFGVEGAFGELADEKTFGAGPALHGENTWGVGAHFHSGVPGV
jgi:hypothetical protein